MLVFIIILVAVIVITLLVWYFTRSISANGAIEKDEKPIEIKTNTTNSSQSQEKVQPYPNQYKDINDGTFKPIIFNESGNTYTTKELYIDLQKSGVPSNKSILIEGDIVLKDNSENGKLNLKINSQINPNAKVEILSDDKIDKFILTIKVV